MRTLLLFGFLLVGLTAAREQISIQMPGALPTHSDTYVCTGVNLNSSTTGSIVGFDFRPAVQHSVHHMLVFACDAPIAQHVAFPQYECFDPCPGSMQVRILWCAWPPRLF